MRTTGARHAFLGIVGAALAGCGAAGGQSTRIRHDDLDAIVNRMVQSLAASDFLRDRTAESPAMRIVIDRVENLSSDVVTEAEGWMIMHRIQAAVPLRTFASERRIRFRLPPQRVALLRRSGFDVPEPSADGSPTHLMAATFRSWRRDGRSGGDLTDLRADTYMIDLSITDIATRALAWSGQFAFKRQARGLIID